MSKLFLSLETGRCCFRIGHGSRMVPCCLKIIDCEEYDNLFEGYEETGPMLGGAIGEHHYCPEDAEEAGHLIAGMPFNYFPPYPIIYF